MYQINEKMYEDLKTELTVAYNKVPELKVGLVDNILMQVQDIKNENDNMLVHMSMNKIMGIWYGCWLSGVVSRELYQIVTTILDDIYNDLVEQMDTKKDG